MPFPIALKPRQDCAIHSVDIPSSFAFLFFLACGLFIPCDPDQVFQLLCPNLR